VLKRENALNAWRGNEGATETPYYEGTIPMTLITRTVRRTLRLPATIAINAKVGQNMRAAAGMQGFTRSTLQTATGETWLNTQRAWFGIEPLAQTIIRAHLAMQVDVRRILPATPKSWA
jgi:hypothetical protein